jgi:16S rRNA G966 N2-methylase RsmD
MAFIEAHLDADPARLLLSAHRWPDIPVAYAASQIEALKKIKTKLPDWYRTDLVMPPKLSVEQSSSATTGAYKAQLVKGQRMADLTGGMGVDTYYLSTSFEAVDYVERQEALVAAARHNFSIFGRVHIHCHQADAMDFLDQIKVPYDLIYLDPARRDEAQKKVFHLTDCEPNVVNLQNQLLLKAKQVLVKNAPLLDISQAIQQLPQVTKVWVVAVANEVKELLLLLEPVPIHHPIEVTAVNLQSQQPDFTIVWGAEAAQSVHYSLPLEYLYEPNAAIMKMGAFRTFAAEFGLHKLHANSHLFTADRLLKDIPGRIFQVEAVVKYDKKAVRAVLDPAQANIATRNFPDSPDVVRQRLQLTDGGDHYLFATTLMDNSRRILVTKKV